MEDKEHAHNDAHFQEELDSLEINMACITSLLKQMLKKISSEGLPNQPKEKIDGQSQEPYYKTTFVQLTILAPASTTVVGFTNEAHMTKSFKHVDYDKIAVLEVRVRAIKGVDMYNLV
jgi:hypothetical protein